jgi:hypothetical protein
MDKTDYVFILCEEYLNELQTNICGKYKYDYYPYFYSALIHKNLNLVNVDFNKNDKSIKEYIIEIYNITNERENEYLEDNIEISDAYSGGHEELIGYLGCLCHLQEMKKILNF